MIPLSTVRCTYHIAVNISIVDTVSYGFSSTTFAYLKAVFTLFSLRTIQKPFITGKENIGLVHH